MECSNLNLYGLYDGWENRSSARLAHNQFPSCNVPSSFYNQHGFDLAYNPHAQVADALSQPFPDASFDLVWSMESGEHMPDKQ